MNDPIVEEIRQIREEHAARFDYDLWAIFRDIKAQQERSGLKYVSFAGETIQSSPSGDAVPPTPVTQRL